MYRYMDNDKDKRFKQVVVTTMNLFLVLVIFAAMNISSYFGKFMAEHDTFVMLILLAVVLFFQVVLDITLHNVSNNHNNTFIILYILVLSSVISSIEVSLISQTAAIITFILCYITLTRFVIFNSQEIPNEIEGLTMGIWLVILMFTVSDVMKSIPI